LRISSALAFLILMKPRTTATLAKLIRSHRYEIRSARLPSEPYPW
jgi:hypothetical protein